MKIPICHEKLSDGELFIKTAGMFGPKVISDQKAISKVGKTYRYTTISGEEIKISLKNHFFDPVPEVSINGENIAIARKLYWYEWCFMCLPVLLVLQGGALGAIFGLMALYSSARIFRSDRNTVLKYILSLLISFLSVVIFLICAVIIQIIIMGFRE